MHKLLICTASILALTAASARAQNIALEEITVTAERRAENLQNVPLAVTAFSDVELEQRQVRSLVDIVRDVPNLIGHNNVGLNTATVVFLRGVGSTQSFSTVDTTVGFYVDDVYIARQNANNFTLFDVERMEVLRGPQGTLYGRNTSGGAIKVVTRKPEPEFAARFEGEYGNYDYVSLKGSLNAPLTERLYTRINVATRSRDGYSENRTLGEDVNDRDIRAVRGALRYEGDTFDIVGSVDWISDEANGIVPSDIQGSARPVTDSLFDVLSGIDNFNDVETWGATVNAEWDLGMATLFSTTGYRQLEQDYVLDLTDQPVPIYVIDNFGEHDQFSQELRLQGDTEVGGNPLQWIVGAFYMYEWNETLIGDELNFQLPSGARLPLGRQFKFLENDVESIAVFGQGTWNATDALALTAGLRFTRDWKDVAVTQFGANGSIVYDTQTLIDIGVPIEQTFEELTPKLGIEYQVTNDVLAYASYTQGFKSGGWNSRVTNARQFYAFEPEFVTAYEAGLKAELFDRRLRLNTALFWSDVSDLILGTIDEQDGGAFATLNADADIYGLEVETRLQATRELQIFANLGLLDGEYKNLGADPQGFADRKLPRVSDVTFKAGASWSRFFDGIGTINLGGDVSYTSEYFASASNREINKVEATTLVAAYIGYDSPDDRWSLRAGCKNCFNEEYFHSMLDFPSLGPSVGFSAAYPGDPRTWTISAQARF